MTVIFRLENLMKLTEPSTTSATSSITTTVGLLASTAAAEQLAKLHKDLGEKIAAAAAASSHVEDHSEPFI